MKLGDVRMKMEDLSLKSEVGRGKNEDGRMKMEELGGRIEDGRGKPSLEI